MIRNGFLHLVSPTQEYWLNLSKVQSIEMPGKSGHPPGWPDSRAAFVVTAENGVGGISLDGAQWQQLKTHLGFDE